MAKTLLTGGTGLIGSHVARALLERGDDLRLTVRESSKTDNLDGLDCDTVRADIHDRRSLRRALKGVDRVFHIAGFTSLRAPAARLYRVNVDGTRTVLEECLRAEVARVVFTSSVAAVGPAKPGSTADERSPFPSRAAEIPYVASKREAEIEALRLAARGLPVVIVNPAHVLGRGDLYRSSTDIVRRFLMRRLPAYVVGALNVVSARDVAAGHLLADEKGTPGERYILGNRNYTLDRLFADLARLSGVEAPALRLAPAVALRLAQALEAGPGRSPISVQEVRLASEWWTYRNAKAKRELGWSTGPHEDTIEATVGWYLDHEGDRLARARRSQPVQWKAAAVAMRAAEGLARLVT